MPDRAEFAAMVRRSEEQLDLAAAALLLARIHEPVEDLDRYLRVLDDFAAELRGRIAPSAEPEEIVRQIGRYLAGEQNFHGNTRHYADPRNSCLNAVLDRRTGIPITLSVVYLEVGWRLGLPLAGVGMPGHFLVKYADDETEIVFDPFYGGAILSPQDCAQRLGQIAGRPVPLEPHYLAAVTRKQILTRILTNLKHIYLEMSDSARLLDTIEHLLLLSPWSLDDIRDRGMVYWQRGDTDRAIVDLETYLTYAADAADAPLVRQHLASFRRQLPPSRS